MVSLRGLELVLGNVCVIRYASDEKIGKILSKYVGRELKTASEVVEALKKVVLGTLNGNEKAEETLEKLYEVAKNSKSKLSEVVRNVYENFEIFEIRKMIYDILRKYGDVSESYIVNHTVEDDIEASKIVHEMLKKVPNTIEDLKKLYELSKKLTTLTNEYNNVLATLEASTLRNLMNVKTVREIRTKGAKALVVSTRFKDYTIVVPCEDCKDEGEEEKRSPNVQICPFEVIGFNVIYTNDIFRSKIIYGKLTTIGAKGEVDVPFREDYVGYTDERGRILDARLMSFGHDEYEFATFEF